MAGKGSQLGGLIGSGVSGLAPRGSVEFAWAL